MSTQHLIGDERTPEQVVARLMADAIEAFVAQMPKWRQMPQIATSEANANRAIAATQIAKAASRLMENASAVLNANIKGVLGHQTRTAYELFFDVAWLRMHDENGTLSEQFMTWHTMALNEINGEPRYGTETMREIRRRYGDRLDKSSDEWTAVAGERNVTNANNRRQAVAAKLEKAGIEGMTSTAQQMFKALNALSHGITATAMGGNPHLAINVMTACYLTVQECGKWLVDIAGGFPDQETHDDAQNLYELAATCLKPRPVEN